MPKLKTPPSVIENRRIIAVIKYGMEMAHVAPSDLAFVMRTSTKTVYSRFKHPGSFRLEELWAVSRKLHIPIEQIIGGESTLPELRIYSPEVQP